MQLFKFFMGIVLVELITAVLFSLSSGNLKGSGLLQFIVPLLFIALVLSFWFDSMAGHSKKDTVEKMKDSFAKEREDIRVKAEKNIAREAKVTHAKANFKVGAAFAGVLGVGALFVFAQMMTAALLTLTAAGGAATGYYYRGKRLAKREAELKQLEIIDVKAIESK
ncbi:MAG TPA: hypothetical protein ENK39_10005 [Epsilonproteobacteria bacterium]|nr:hypothetical protein [Campylobacterota bacterium]